MCLLKLLFSSYHLLLHIQAIRELEGLLQVQLTSPSPFEVLLSTLQSTYLHYGVHVPAECLEFLKFWDQLWMTDNRSGHPEKTLGTHLEKYFSEDIEYVDPLADRLLKGRHEVLSHLHTLSSRLHAQSVQWVWVLLKVGDAGKEESQQHSYELTWKCLRIKMNEEEGSMEELMAHHTLAVDGSDQKVVKSIVRTHQVGTAKL